MSDPRKDLLIARNIAVKALRAMDSAVFEAHAKKEKEARPRIADIETYAELRRDIHRAMHEVCTLSDKYEKLVDRVSPAKAGAPQPPANGPQMPPMTPMNASASAPSDPGATSGASAEKTTGGPRPSPGTSK